MNFTCMDLPKYVIEALLKFPTDPFLLEMNVICNMHYIECQNVVKLCALSALNWHPNNVRLLFAKATALSIAEEPQTDAATEIQAWNDFLKYAPKDHSKVPAAHYWFEKLLTILREILIFKSNICQKNLIIILENCH